jgi:hypothetical protein
VRFDHALENVFDGDMLTLACEVISDSENGSEIVGRVTPWNDVIQYYIQLRDVARVGDTATVTYILQRGSSR